MAGPRLKFNYQGEWAYALTVCCMGKQSKFIEDSVVQACIKFLKQACEKYKFEIWCYCFMPDHLHLLLRGGSLFSDLKKCIELFKQLSGFWYKQTHRESLWQGSYYDQVIAREEKLEPFVRYILENPVRAGLVKDYRNYPFSGSLVFNIERLI